jgi:hypothetical protein
MARPEIIGRKVEETTVESTKKGKGKSKSTRKRHPLPPRRQGDAYTIPEFCATNRISESMYHKLKSLGLGPREMDVGRRRIITPEANAEWQAAREREAASASASAA